MAKKDKRATITAYVEKRIYEKSRFRCAKCKERVLNDEAYIGEIAHIEAASSGFLRFNPNTDSKEKAEEYNLILLCRNCHKIVDSDESKYTVEVLQEMKRKHETKVFYNNDMTEFRQLINEVKNIHLQRMDDILFTMYGENGYTMPVIEDCYSDPDIFPLPISETEELNLFNGLTIEDLDKINNLLNSFQNMDPLFKDDFDKIIKRKYDEYNRAVYLGVLERIEYDKECDDIINVPYSLDTKSFIDLDREIIKFLRDIQH